MNSGVRKLSEYLSAHGFEGAVSPKILISPSTKDFFNIVAFLLKQLDPHIKITGKLEDEFITMFKYFGYPFNIAKSSISAVGSPHAWPTLLACLTWLLEILQYHQLSVEAEQHEEMDADPSASEKGFYAYLARAYSMFLSCKDEQYDQLERQFIKSFEDKDILVQDQVEALEMRNGAIAAEIEQIKNRSSYLPELVAKKKEFQGAHSQFAALVEDLQQVRKQIFDKVEQRKFELQSVNNGIAALEEKIASMRNTIQTQELSPEDVLNLVNERKRLEDANAVAVEARQGVQRQIKELEVSLRTRVGALEEAVKMYHTYAEGLKLVPVSARNARGLDLSIEVDIRARKKEGLLKTEVRNHVLPALQQMKAELTQTTFELRNERMREEEELGEIEAQKSEHLETIAAMEAKQRRAEVGYKREKELLDQSAAIQTTEIDGMEARLMQLRDTAMAEATLTAAKRRIAEITAMRAARKAEHERKIAAMKESIMETVSMCADHREMVQQQLEDLKAQYTHRLQVVLNPVPVDGGEGYMGDSILSEGLEY
jgi:kinetochore protein NDC80